MSVPLRNTLFKYGKVSDDTNVVNNDLLDIVIKHPKAAGVLYKKLVNDRNDQPYDMYDKWFTEIGYEPFDTELDWYAHAYECYLCTRSIELRSFMYKFHMRDLATRKKLSQMKLAPDSTCMKCNLFTEDIQHMFWDCVLIKKLWSDLHTWLSKLYGFKL